MMLDDQATAAAAAAARGGLASPTRLAPAAESDEAVAAAAADEEGARVANEEAALLPRFTRALAIADPLTHGPRIVRQPFEQHEQDELDLVVGDLVHLKRVFSDAWAFGVSEATGREGVFPLCALDPASDDDYVLVALLEDLAGLPAATPVAEFSSSDEAASSSYASGSGGTPLLD
ncbi:hypothetical protein BC828DRAFT_377946 [Blastocladiella britannica]|nr:hypothetical protein BC828DRAFT_377946 [Blastocladiella britannica]